MLDNRILNEAEEKESVNEFELIEHYDSEQLINHLIKNKDVLIDIIQICGDMIRDYEDLIGDINSHDRLKDDSAIENEYPSKITRRIDNFNKLSKSLNNEIKKTELVFDKWLEENEITTPYMIYAKFNDSLKNNNEEIGWLTIANELLCYAHPTDDDFKLLVDLCLLYESNVNLTEEFILEVINTAIDSMNIYYSIEGISKLPHVRLDEDGDYIWDI